MELEKFEQKQVAAISELQRASDLLYSDAQGIIVIDNDSLKIANEKVKQINAHKKLVQTKRLDLTQPLNNVIKQLIAKEKEVLLPLDEGKTNLSEKILTYSEDVERKRQEEITRVNLIIEDIETGGYLNLIETVEDADIRGADLKEHYSTLPESDQSNPLVKVAFMTTIGKISDRKNQIIEEARAEAECQRQAEEQNKLDAERAKQSEEEARLAAERREHEAAKRQIEEDKLQIERDKAEMIRQKELQEAEKEAFKLEKEAAKNAKAAPKSNIVTTMNYEIYNDSIVPREYCTPDMTKIRAAIKAAPKDTFFSIPGVRISEEKKVR